MEIPKYMETIIILNPKTTALKADITKLKSIYQTITSKYGKEIDVNAIGEKKLAYKIKDTFDTGYYIQIYWMGTEEDVAYTDRLLRIDDDVIKFLQVSDVEHSIELKDLKTEPSTKSTLKDVPNALDVLLGLADYT